MLQSMNYFNRGIAAVETVWNVFDSIPGVGIVTGLARMPAGAVQATAFGVLFVGTNVSRLCCSKSIWERNISPIHQFAEDHVVHGIANVAKGPFNAFLAIDLSGFIALFATCVLTSNSREDLDYIRPAGSWRSYQLFPIPHAVINKKTTRN